MEQSSRAPLVGKYQHAQGILEIVRKGLCTRCSGCIGLCPSGTLKLDQNGFPQQVDECTSCGICTDICSGATVDYPVIGSWLFGDQYHYDPPLGIVRNAFVGHSTEDEIRWKGTSGGVVTKLLIHLLETSQVEGALVVGPHPNDNSMGLGRIARSRDELLYAAQSRYTTVPMLTALQDIKKEKGKYAVVSLPCQVHTLRKLQMKSKTWRKRIHLIIGLFCHYRLPHQATREFAELMGPENATLTDIKYRQKDDKGWPQNTIEISFSDDSRWRSPYGSSQTVSLLAHCYPRGRCISCIDGLNEFGDIGIGDPYIMAENGKWKFSEPAGNSIIFARTEKGLKAIQDGAEKGALLLESINPKELADGQRMMLQEKIQSTPVRMTLLGQILRRPMPEYNVQFEPLTLKLVFKELMFGLMRTITIFPPVRRFFVRLGFSSTGRKFMKMRRKRNKKRAVARLAAKS